MLVPLAAISIGNRIGSGKVRHIEVTQLWLQDKVTQKVIVLNKVGTDDNLADALTKAVDAAAIRRYLDGATTDILLLQNSTLRVEPR